MSVLTFDRPAAQWLECLPLGNGALGVMHDGDIPVARLGLNDETAWSGSPASEASGGLLSADDAATALAAARAAIADDDPAAAEVALASTQATYSQAYLPLGTLLLRREGVLENYRRTLDLGTAVHEVRSGALFEQTFVSAPHGVLVHLSSGAVTADIETPLRELWRRETGADLVIGVRMPSDVAPGHEPQLPGATWDAAPGAALEGAIAVRVLPVDAAGRTTVLVATATTFSGLGAQPRGTADDAAAAALARLDAAQVVGADTLLAAHVADHAALFDRVRIDLGKQPEGSTADRLGRAFAAEHPLTADPTLAALLFDFGRYLNIAASRPGGLPTTLQGIWNAELRPPWSSNYTINVNTQMNYWSAFPTDLAETAQPLFDLVEALAAAGTETARRLYDAPGWVAHHNTDAWALTSPVGAGHGDARWTAWPMAGPWLVRTLWEAVEFGADAAVAERLWPIVRGAAEFALAWHHRDASGAWVTAPATSPENAYLLADGTSAAVDASTAMDQALLHDLFGITVALSERVGRGDDPVAVAARQRQVVIPAEPAITGLGIVREWARERPEEDPHHRHLSPLYGLHPGPGHWSDVARAAATATLERRGDDSSGWSLIWKTALWARLGRGDKVSDLLRLVFRDASGAAGEQWRGGLYPNLFAAHPPFQIDANLAFPGVLAESLLQSHDGIELLPALPAELADGDVTGLVARPGIRVDLSWRGGELRRASLLARTPAAAGDLRIRYRGAERIHHVSDTAALQLDGAAFEEVGSSR